MTINDEPLFGVIAIDKIIKSGSLRSKMNPYETPPRPPPEPSRRSNASNSASSHTKAM